MRSGPVRLGRRLSPGGLDGRRLFPRLNLSGGRLGLRGQKSKVTAQPIG
jgi:hypothetical protein